VFLLITETLSIVNLIFTVVRKTKSKRATVIFLYVTLLTAPFFVAA